MYNRKRRDPSHCWELRKKSGVLLLSRSKFLARLLSSVSHLSLADHNQSMCATDQAFRPPDTLGGTRYFHSSRKRDAIRTAAVSHRPTTGAHMDHVSCHVIDSQVSTNIIPLLRILWNIQHCIYCAWTLR